MAASSADAVERAQALDRTVVRGVADEVRELPFGFALLTPSLPAVHAVNGLWVLGHHPGLTATDLVAQADALAGEHDHRRIDAQEETTGRRLESTFRAEGWQVEREALMLLEAEPDRPADTSAVREVEPTAIEDAQRAAWRADGGWTPGDEEVEQLLERDRRIGAVVRARAFAVVEDGATVAFARLIADAGVALVEDVATLPAARGRGHARALVTHAAAVARDEGHDVVCIVAADEEGPARELYAKLGFVPAARSFAFTRR
jgi:ribosomal protein S18 acetylase RimI-like enzyme